MDHVGQHHEEDGQHYEGIFKRDEEESQHHEEGNPPIGKGSYSLKSLKYIFFIKK